MWADCALVPPPSHAPSFSHTLHGDLHHLVVLDAPQGLDVARCGHGPAAVAVFLAGKGGGGKVSGPLPPLPRHATEAGLGQMGAGTCCLMGEMVPFNLRQSQLEGSDSPDSSDPTFLPMLGASPAILWCP